MDQRETLDPDDLHRPEWNSLLNNYSKHDIGEAYFVGRAEQMGLTIEHWGIDKRHNDDHLIFDNKMDLRLWEPKDGQNYPPTEPEYATPIHTGNTDSKLRALVDVKTKANEDWLGKFNLRHLAHYAEHAYNHRQICPTFVYMTMVDPDAETVGRSNIIAPIPHDWNWELLCAHYDSEAKTSLSYGDLKDTARECRLVDRTFRAPDGNLVIEMNEDMYIDFDRLYDEIAP